MRSFHCVSLALFLSYSMVACGSSDDSGAPAGSGGKGGAVGVAGSSGSSAAAGAGDSGGAAGADSDTSGAAGVTSGAAGDASNPDTNAGAGGDDGNTTVQGGNGGSGGTAACTADLTCPTFANGAPVIHDECVAAAMPVGKSGPVVADGIYFRTKSQIYTGGSCSPATARQETLLVKCGAVQFINSGDPPAAATAMFSGSDLKLTVVCPQAEVLDFTYDSTATTFTTYEASTSKVHTYTRQ